MKSTFARNIPPPTEPRNQLNEGITNYFDCSAKPASKSKSLLPQIPANAKDFALTTLNFPADATQQQALSTESNRVIICCTRQWGKSTTAALKILHHALTKPGALVLIASKGLRQSGELLDKAVAFAQTLDIPIRRCARNPDSLLLPNHSRILALPGEPDNLRGYSAVTMLVIDEAAYVTDELYHAFRPMLATTNGAIWLLSTPNGRTGFFYDQWSSDDSRWAKFMVTAEDCPRIDREFLEEERKTKGPAVFRREYFCDFSYAGQSYFDLDALDDAVGAERFYAAANFAAGRPPDRFYIGLDIGQKVSHTAIVVIEKVSGVTNERNPVTFEWIKEMHLIIRKVERLPLDTSYDAIIVRVGRLIRELGDPLHTTLLVDATGCGQPFLEMLRREKMGVIIAPICITSGGSVTSSGSVDHVPKRDLMYNANYTLNSKVLSGEPGLAGVRELREEMDAYRIRTSRAGTNSFRTAQKDDLVMAFALAVWRIRSFLPRPRQ